MAERDRAGSTGRHWRSSRACRRTLALILAAASALAAQAPDELAELAKTAVEARKNGQPAAAERAFEELTTRAPELLPAWLNLGLVRHEQHKYAEAAAAFERALTLDPDLTEAASLLGFDLVQTGRFEEAVPHLERATRVRPDDAQAASTLGVAYLNASRPHDAVRVFERLRAARPNDPALKQMLVEAHLATAAAATKRGELSAAIDAYEAALTVEPATRGIRRTIADLHAELGALDSAIASYREELTLGSEPLTLERLGDALLQAGRSGEALGPLRRAAELSPQPAGSRVLLGRALMDLGEWDEAKATLLSALASDPPIEAAARAHYALGTLYSHSGDRQQAAAHLQQFRRLRSQLVTQAAGGPAP